MLTSTCKAYGFFRLARQRATILGLLIALCLGAFPAHAAAATATPTPTVSARLTVNKEVCRSLAGYDSLDALKRELEIEAKRDAANELFGELIVASTTVQNWMVTEDQLRSQSLGLVRVEGSPVFSSGTNLGDICVRLTVYVTDRDLARFEPQTITRRACVSGADRTLRRARTAAEEAARLQALHDYDIRLRRYEPASILPLLRQVAYLESNVAADTDNYCVTVRGALIPIEVDGFLALDGALLPVPVAAAPTATPTLDHGATATAEAATTEAAARATLAAQATATEQAAALRLTLTAQAPTRTPTSTRTPPPTRTPTPTHTLTPQSTATEEELVDLLQADTPTHTLTPQSTATATVTTIATATASALPRPTGMPTAAPASPTLRPTPAPTARPAAAPAGARVDLLYPDDNTSTTGRLDFSWTPINLAPGYAYELVFWCCDPAAAMVDGRGYAGGYTTATNSSMNFAASGLGYGEYRWAILLVRQSPYQRIEQISEVRTLRFVGEDQGDGGGRAYPAPEPTEAKPKRWFR